MPELKDIVETLEKKLGEYKEKTTEEAKAEVKKLEGQLEAFKGKEVKEMQDKMTEQGATIGQMQGEIKELKAKRARPAVGQVNGLGSIQADISKALGEHEKELKELTQSGTWNRRVELKAPGPILSTNLASGTYIDYLDWRPGMEPTGQTRIRELVRTVASAFDNVSFPRANTPIGQGSIGRQIPEGSAKQQVDRNYTMINLALTTMAGWLTVSRQSLRNIPFLQTWMPTSLNEQLLDTEDNEFGQALFSAATGSATVPASYTATIEILVYLLTNMRKAKFVPTGIAMAQEVWASMLLTKPQNYSLPNAVVITPNGDVRILGTPTYGVNWLTNGQTLVGDWTKAAIVESEGLSFRQSDNVASQFIQNEITFLLERTNGLANFRPDAFIKKTITIS